MTPSPSVSQRFLRALLRLPVFMALLWLGGCAGMGQVHPPTVTQALAALPPTAAILLGEQHDAPDHQRIARDVVQQLAAQQQLAALLVEMADHGRHTQGLPADADETRVRGALGWDDRAWPWAAYGPVVMRAVRAGVPVLGANLPRPQLRQAMADAQLDTRLDAAAQSRLRELIRLGHCDQLPASQLQPMVRVQIARDWRMAQTLRDAAVPGRTVLLLAGQVHVDRSLGIPRHLPAGFEVQAIGLGDSAPEPGPDLGRPFDRRWPAQPAPAQDYCAAFKPTARP